MSSLVNHLRSFNRKERFILLTETLGERTFSLDAGFRRRLSTVLGTDVPSNAFVAMDYHLDWLQMALFLARTPNASRLIRKGDVLSEGQEDFNANQMDIDLLVAFDQDATTHLVLLEAKMETGWTNQQMRKRARRLHQIFRDESGSIPAQPHLVLLSPRPPRRLDTATWCDWMKRNGKPVWMELPRPVGLRKVSRCDESGHASEEGGFLRMDILAGSDSNSIKSIEAEDGGSVTFAETVKGLRPLMETLRGGQEHSWDEYSAAPRAGVYVFYEHGEPVYVGRSNRLRDRIREHGAASSDRHSATFAFKLLRKDLGDPAGAAKDIEAAHIGEFRGQRERVRAMTFRAVPIDDQLEQTLFETYAILELGTYPENNDFDTH